MKKLIITISFIFLLSTNVLAHNRNQLCNDLNFDIERIIKIIKLMEENKIDPEFSNKFFRNYNKLILSYMKQCTSLGEIK